MDSQDIHQERVGDQDHCRIGDAPHRPRAIKFVDDIGDHKFERPQQDAAGQGKSKPALTKHRKVYGMHPKEFLQGEQLGADGVGDQRIAAEESGKAQEQFGRPIL